MPHFGIARVPRERATPALDRARARAREARAHLLQHLQRRARADERRGADLDRGGADGQELERVAARQDAPRSDHRDLHRLRALEAAGERERLDGGTRQPAGLAVEPGMAAPEIDGQTDERVDGGDRAGAAGLAGARQLADRGDVGRELRDQRFRRERPEAPERRLEPPRLRPVAGAALAHVGAREVDLERGDRRQVRELGQQSFEMARRVAADRGDDRGSERREPGDLLRAELREPDVLEADRVEHAARGLRDPLRRIPGAGLERHGLRDDAAQESGIDDMRVLVAVAERAGGDEHGVRELEPADAHPEVRARGLRGAAHATRVQSSSRASNTGPSVQHIAYSRLPSSEGAAPE